jgi:hypothetical protein
LDLGRRESLEDSHRCSAIERKHQQFLFVVVSGVAPTKSDLPFGERDQAMIRDGYAMGGTAQILEHILGTTER